MKINGVTIENFKGIEHLTHKFSDPVTLVYGPMGSGKTSFIQGVTFGLTGELPSSPIRTGAEQSNVILDCGEELCIERDITFPKKSNVRIVGRKVGKGASSDYISEQMSVGNEIIKIATSTEKLSKLKPSEFGSIFLDETEEKMKIEEIHTILKEIDSKEKKKLMEDVEDDDLPADLISELKKIFTKKILNLEDIHKAYDEARVAKREFTALHKSAVSRSKNFLEITRPEYNEAEIQKKLEEVIGVEKNIANYKKDVEVYNNALANKKEQDRKVAKIELDIARNRSTEPDKAALKVAQDELAEYEKQLQNQRKILTTLTDNIKRYKLTLEKLDKPVCPISEKLICKTDKTECKDDLDRAIFDNEDSADNVEHVITDLKNKIAEKKMFMESYQKNKEQYEKLLFYKKELADLAKHKVVVPERPESFNSKTDYTEVKADLQDRLDLIRRYNEGAAEYKESQVLKRMCVVYDFITKALEPKGPVIQQFLETFAEYLETSCNERAELLKMGFETRFVVEDGLKVLFKPKDKTAFLPFSNLSNGEKVFAEVILIDLINSFHNSRILIIDNTDNLDENSFRQLLDFVTREETKDLYDNIFIGFVNHSDLLDVMDEYEVDKIGF